MKHLKHKLDHHKKKMDHHLKEHKKHASEHHKLAKALSKHNKEEVHGFYRKKHNK